MENVTTKQLFMDGDGRLTCSALECAGATAHFSAMKRDLSGAEIVRLTPEAAREFAAMTGEWPRCESCGCEATLLAAEILA